MRKMNGWTVTSRIKPGKLKAALVCLALVATLSMPRVMAGTEMKPVDPKCMTCTDKCCSEKDWTIELASGVSWSNVRSGQPNQPYTTIPISLQASLKLDDVSLDDVAFGIFRGYSEFYFEGQYEQIVHGPENHYEGIMVGPRYNFVQKGWPVIPYVEGGVGIGFADSNPSTNPNTGGLGQDFNFSFSAGAGLKYNICDDFFVRLGVEYQHVSNAGLSEPQFQNHPIDELGPKLSFGYSF